MTLFDTHAHYDDEQFDPDRTSSFPPCRKNGIGLIVNAASNLPSSEKGLALADIYPFVYAAVGVHPHDSKQMDGDTASRLEKLLSHPKAVAVGEIGLDYHYDHSPRDVQQKRFREQLELARHVKKPVIIHEREAPRDTLDILRDYPDVTGVFHCYSGSWETAKNTSGQGVAPVLHGVITYRNRAAVAHEVIEKNARAKRIMIETDCPYLAPEPRRGRRNSSLNLILHGAEAGRASADQPGGSGVADSENGLRFFGITI
jgi:TatD DNase family protein